MGRSALSQGWEYIRSNGIFQTGKKVYSKIILPNLYKKMLQNHQRAEKDPKLIIFFGESDYGQGNSKYVFEYICENRDDLDAIWLTDNEYIINELKNKSLPVEKKTSLMGAKLIREAKLGLASSASHVGPEPLIPESLTLIHLSHGDPVKFDSKDDKKTNNGSSMDYVIKTSDTHINEQAREGTKNGPVYLITGYPRNDILFESEIDFSFFASDGANTVDDPDHVILYAPTKRKKKRFDNPLKIFPFDDFDICSLESFLDEHDAVIFLNFHPTTMRQLSNPELQNWMSELQDQLDDLTDLDRIILTSDDNFVFANELMSISDVLITDYSSMYHDFLLLNRPILFFPYDYDMFEQKVGFSYDYYSNLPGTEISSFHAFLNQLECLFSGKDDKKRERQLLMDKIHRHQDGNSTERVVDAIDVIRNDECLNEIENIPIIK